MTSSTELAAILERELAEAMEGRGRALFVVTAPGQATRDQVAAFQEEAFRHHAKLRVAYVDCVHTTPEDDAWAQFERILTRRYRLRGSARRLAGDWLEVIPILGPALRAVWVTVQTVVRGEPPEQEAPGPRAVRGAAARGAAARAAAGHERGSDLWMLEPLEPRLLVVENFQQAFPGELAGTSTLLTHLKEMRTLFVAVVRVEGPIPQRIDDLVLEAERSGRGQRVRVEPARVGGAAEAGAAAASGRAVSGSAAASGPARRALDEAERDLLALEGRERDLLARAAVEGPVLHPLFLEGLLGVPELELEDRFTRLVRAGVLESLGMEEVRGEPTGAYAFRKDAVRQVLLGLLEPRARDELERAAERLRAGAPSPDLTGEPVEAERGAE